MSEGLEWLLSERLFKLEYYKQPPGYLFDRFTERKASYDFNEAAHKLVLPRPRTEFLKRSFPYNGNVLWNSLLEEARAAGSLTLLKNVFEINGFNIGLPHDKYLN